MPVIMVEATPLNDVYRDAPLVLHDSLNYNSGDLQIIETLINDLKNFKEMCTKCNDMMKKSTELERICKKVEDMRCLVREASRRIDAMSGNTAVA